MEKKETETKIPFAASARSLDLEYLNIGNVPTLGIAIKCPCCHSPFAVPFDSTLGAWRALVDAIATLTGVGRRDLLQQGRRPTEEASSARRLLVHALRKVSNEATAIRWLTLLGFQSRWVKKELDAKLDSTLQRLLDTLPVQFSPATQPSPQEEND